MCCNQEQRLCSTGGFRYFLQYVSFPQAQIKNMVIKLTVLVRIEITNQW